MSLMPLGAAYAASMFPAGLDAATGRMKPSRGTPRGRRGQQVAADHAAALGRAYAYAMQLARTDDEREEATRAYEHRMAEGPDFTRARSKSDFREPPPHKLDRNEVARLKVAFDTMCRGMWRVKDAGRHRGAISRTTRDVFHALLFLAQRHNRLFPSLARLATLAQCCTQSVVTALARLEEFGFLTRHRRLKRLRGVMGLETAQDTNAYEVHWPRRGWGVIGLDLFGTVADSKSWRANSPESLSFLIAHPESWGSPSIARGDAHGEPPSAAHI